MLSERQESVIRHAVSDDVLCLAGGSIRSGKTFAANLGFVLWSIGKSDARTFLITGVTVESVTNNVIYSKDGIMDALMELGFEPDYNQSRGHRVIVATERGTLTYRIIGASDAKARKRTQGATFGGAYFDEIALIPQDYFMTVWGRLSEDGAKAWATYNPESPFHWLKKEIIDVPDKWDAVEHRFSLDDNPSLSQEYKDRIRKSYWGVWEKRYIDGEWVAPGGAIWPEYTIESIPDGYWPEQWVIGLDWGISGTFAALLIGKTPTGYTVHRERYIVGDQGAYLSEDDQASQLRHWAEAESQRTARGMRAYVDPSTSPTFKRLLRNHGFHVIHGDNTVEPGLMTTGARLARGEVTIDPRCSNLIGEIAGYSWDETAAKQGVSRPVKAADHGPDALRYWAYTTGKIAFMPDKNITLGEVGLYADN